MIRTAFKAALLGLPIHAVATVAALAQMPAVETLTTPQGHEMHVMAMPDADYATLVFFWAGQTGLGSEGREGLYQLGPRLLFEDAGGRTLPEIQEDMSDIGVDIGIANTFSGTSLYIQTDAEGSGLEDGADLARSLLTEAALDPDDLGRLKRNFADGLAEGENDPSGQLLRTLGALLAPGDRRLSALTNRPPETVEAVEISDVRTWMDATFDDRPLVVAAGPISAERVGTAVDIVLANLPPAMDGSDAGPDPFDLRAAGRTVAIRTPRSDVAIVAAAFPAPTEGPELDAAMNALAGGDGARLFKRLREKEGATYGFSWSQIPLTVEQRVIQIGGAVPADRVSDVLEILRAELDRLRTEGLESAEFDAFIEQRLALEAQIAADPVGAAGLLIDEVIRGRAISLDVVEVTDRMSLEGVNTAIAEIIPSRVTVVVATPKPDATWATCIVDIPEEAETCVGDD